MQDAKTYLKDELNQKIPQKIISHMLLTKIDKDEKVLAILGAQGLMGSFAFVLSTEDRIIYYNNALGMVAKQFVILYSDLSDALLKTEGNAQFIYLISKGKENFKINVKAPVTETKKMFDFIQNYKDTGILFIEKRLCDPKYSMKIDAIHNHGDMKIAEKNAAIHEKYELQANKILSDKSHASYKLNYCSGLGSEFIPGLIQINVDIPERIIEFRQNETSLYKVPLKDIKGSSITTDKDIPPSDMENEYVFYLHISYLQDGVEKEILFSRKQKQNSTIDLIDQLHYFIQHLGEKLEQQNEQDARYSQKMTDLKENHQRLLEQREEQIQQTRNIFSTNPTNGKFVSPNRSRPEQQTVSAPQNSVSSNAVDEIKKYKELLDQGILTQEEFDAKKKQLLNL